jgi:YQGE family putative transporter
LIGIPANTKKFIFTHFNFLLFTTIPGVFINTFFFRQNGSIATVAIYNAICVFGSALVMQISSQISLKKSPVFVVRIGVLTYNVFYVSLLLLQKNAVEFMPLLAIMNAIASGFYWQGYNELMKICTSEDNFDRTISMMGLANAVVTLVIPIISGLLITNIGGKLGYSIVFALSFIFSIYTTYLSTRIEKAKIHGKSNLKIVYKHILTDRKSLEVYSAEMFRGIRNMAFPLFLSIIFFKFVSNEALLGVNSMLCGFAAMFSYIIAAKIVNQNNRLKFIISASLISLVVSIPLFRGINTMAVFLLAIFNSVIATYIDNTSVAVFYSTFKETRSDINFSQIMAAREIFFGAGRVIGYVLLILLSGSTFNMAMLVLIFNVSPIITWVLFRHAESRSALKTTAG